MKILVFIDQFEGHIKKSSYEVLSYASALANQLGASAEGLVLGTVKEDLTALGKYGVSVINQIEDEALNSFDSQVYAKAIVDVCNKIDASIVVISHNPNGKSLSARVAVKLNAGLVAGAVALPNTNNGFVVKKSVFSGKAFANVSISSNAKVISLNPNSYNVSIVNGVASLNKLNIEIAPSKVKVVATNKVSGEVPLTEADIVVSGGRGLKGPENWGILLDLAKELGAATACSRPVGDAHWRPHHEHVGQTGVQVAPNLYIAIGISGAIQHLAGVNRSKVMVVINKDPEAPFFKAADYGIVGDAFEVVPKLTQEIKKLKASV